MIDYCEKYFGYDLYIYSWKNTLVVWRSKRKVRVHILSTIIFSRRRSNYKLEINSLVIDGRRWWLDIVDVFVSSTSRYLYIRYWSINSLNLKTEIIHTFNNNSKKWSNCQISILHNVNFNCQAKYHARVSRTYFYSASDYETYKTISREWACYSFHLAAHMRRECISYMK